MLFLSCDLSRRSAMRDDRKKRASVSSAEKLFFFLRREKYKEKFYHGLDNYLHTIINMCKRIMTTTVRMTGVTKAVITGGGRANKARPAEAVTIYADNAELGAAVLDIGHQVLHTEKEPYKFESRKLLEAAVQKAAKLAEMIGGRGAGSVNEGACTSTSKQLVTEINNMASLTFPPSMKTNVLYIVQLHASLIEKFSEASNTDLKINESKRLEELSKAFPIIAKEVFPHMPDLTYAQPLVEACALVPRVTFDVRELVKTAAMYTAGETYATNSSKMLFFLLNEIRRNAMAGFPPGPYDSKFPQVGPPDAQFQLSSAEFATSIAESSASPRPELTEAEATPRLDGINFDDMTYAPTPSQEEEYQMTSSGGPLSMSVSSYGSHDSSDTGDGQSFDVYGSPIVRAHPPHLSGSNGMQFGSAPANSHFGQAMGHRAAFALSSSQGNTAITFGDVPAGKFAPPGVARPAPPGTAPPSTPPTASPGSHKFAPLAHVKGPSPLGFGPGGPGSAKLPMTQHQINSSGNGIAHPTPSGPASAKLPFTNNIHGRPLSGSAPEGGPAKFTPLVLGTPPGTPPPGPPPSNPPPTTGANGSPGPLKGPVGPKGGFFKGPSPPPHGGPNGSALSSSPPVTAPPGAIKKMPPQTPPQMPAQGLSNSTNGAIASPGPTKAPFQPAFQSPSPNHAGTVKMPVNGSPLASSGGAQPKMGSPGPSRSPFAGQPPTPGSGKLPGTPPPQMPPPQVVSPGPTKSPFSGPPPSQPPVPGVGKAPFKQPPPTPTGHMTAEMQQQQMLLQQQQQIIQQQQQQILAHQQQQQMLQQQQEQAEMIRKQAEELERQKAEALAAEEARKADEALKAEEAARQAEEDKKASALDELSKLEWNI